MKISALLRRSESGLVVVMGLQRIHMALSMTDSIVIDAPGIGDVLLRRHPCGAISAHLDEAAIDISLCITSS